MPRCFSREVICFAWYAVSTSLPRCRGWVTVAPVPVAAERFKTNLLPWSGDVGEERESAFNQTSKTALWYASTCNNLFREWDNCTRESWLQLYLYYHFPCQDLMLFSKWKFSFFPYFLDAAMGMSPGKELGLSLKSWVHHACSCLQWLEQLTWVCFITKVSHCLVLT